jgi:hypothetical protein
LLNDAEYFSYLLKLFNGKLFGEAEMMEVQLDAMSDIG